MSNQKLHISKMGLFNTPDSVKAIEDWINRHPPTDRIHLWTAMGMTWNYLAEAIEEVNRFGGDNHPSLSGNSTGERAASYDGRGSVVNEAGSGFFVMNELGVLFHLVGYPYQEWEGLTSFTHMGDVPPQLIRAFITLTQDEAHSLGRTQAINCELPTWMKTVLP